MVKSRIARPPAPVADLGEPSPSRADIADGKVPLVRALPQEFRAKSIRYHSRRQTSLAKHAFLEAYAQWGNLGHAAKAAGINRSTVYGWQERDEAFALAYRQAEIAATEVLEKEAWRRAVEGSPYERTSYWHGEPVGTDRKIEYSDQLLTLLLRARAPERYREKVDLASTVLVKVIAGVEPSSVL
jgi:hypothetical protein